MPSATNDVSPMIEQEGLVQIDGYDYYAVPDVGSLPPFLVAVVSPSDHWLYVSTAGGLTAGRGDANHCLFPYRTDDLLHKVQTFSGGYTGIRVGEELWEPFTGRLDRRMHRSIARSINGDRFLVEEIHRELGLRARCTWCFSDRSGIVRRIALDLIPGHGRPCRFDLLDGLRELVPAGAGVGVMQSMSCLINAYTRAERTGSSTLATIAMESALSDRAEPAESLHATVVWGTGLPDAGIHLQARAASEFAEGRALVASGIMLGEPAAYLRGTTLEIGPDETVEFSTVADVHRSQTEVVAIRDRLDHGGDLDAALSAEIDESSTELATILAETDGIQCSGHPVLDAHHRSNTLYNDMRGGVPFNAELIPWGDWVEFLHSRNVEVYQRHAAWLRGRSSDEMVHRSALLGDAADLDDPSLERLALEYLPFWFGRRHGDPSRPWNAFNIRIRHADGSRRLFYEGNWRDIFQNWEALALSHPGWLPHVIAKFVNATTPDGFNAYRLTRDGIDWEVPEPNNPWSNLGYWGDHQIVYLTRLLELSQRIDPSSLQAWMHKAIFSSADVPYRIAPFESLVADPRRTITFDDTAHEAAMGRVDAVGADGRLVTDRKGVVHSNLAEKLLIPVLAKLSNFVPDGGVWMNTQRPEWNDANNALAGYGLSMVTACQLRRHIALLREIYRESKGPWSMSSSVAHWARGVLEVFDSERGLLESDTIDDRDRRRVLDRLGSVFERRCGETHGRADTELDEKTVLALFDRAIEWLDHAVASNRRADGLYHGYNLAHFRENSLGIEHLPEMLEGQMAVLSSGTLSLEESASLIETLFHSKLHRDDLDTFLLQPVRRLPALLDKGEIPSAKASEIALFETLESQGDEHLVERAVDGKLRFATTLVNARDVDRVLDRLEKDPDLAELVAKERVQIRDLYESVFNHLAFTGRSGGMYGYEGIGCTYWHMVAKLLLAVGENVEQAIDEEATDHIRDRLVEAYHRVRDGLGFRMHASRFGALPIDAYSHSPADGGARQPGMTGQVKEELLTRRLELGVRFQDGCLAFQPPLLLEEEWLDAPAQWRIPTREQRTITLPVDSLAFQCCGVPVIYQRGSSAAEIEIEFASDDTQVLAGNRLDASSTRKLCGRTGEIRLIRVRLAKD